MKLLDVATMQRFDNDASARVGATELMRRAGHATAVLVQHMHAQKPCAQIIAFAGPGNNGGDAFAACAEIQKDIACTIYAAPTVKMSDARLAAVARAREAGVRIAALPSTVAGAQATIVPDSIVLDGLFGIGGRSDTSNVAGIIEAMNALADRVIALDIPTGIDGTSGIPGQPAVVRATCTLCFGFVKSGVIQAAARDFVGTILLAEIGMPMALSPELTEEAKNSVTIPELLSPREAQALLPQRSADGDKRTSGAPLIFAGSVDYPGAAVLCTRGAARAGAGYVTVVTARASAVRAHCIEQVAIECDLTTMEELSQPVRDALSKSSALAIGPGLGADRRTADAVRMILEATDVPVVIDAGAVRGMRDYVGLLRNRKCVLTPHAGEFAFLIGTDKITPGMHAAALTTFVEKTGITTLLKGRPTLIASFDRATRSARMFVNATGTEHLATAGTGDVLTGIIATLLSQGLAPVDAARIGAYIHGLAGRAAGRRNERGVIAGDVADALAEVWPALRLAAERQTAVPYFRVDDVLVH